MVRWALAWDRAIPDEYNQVVIQRGFYAFQGVSQGRLLPSARGDFKGLIFLVLLSMLSELLQVKVFIFGV